jgi:hypothetical protein
MRREIAEHGWEIAGPAAHPRIGACDTDAIRRPLTETDVLFATVCCEALARFIAKNQKAFEADVLPPLSETMTVNFDVLEVGLEVGITIPHPDATEDDEDGELWEEEDEFELLLDERDTLMERLHELAHSGAVEIIADFINLERRKGRDSSWLQVAAYVLMALHDCMIEFSQGRGGWTAKDVEAFLLEDLEAPAHPQEDFLRITPEALEAFITWLERTDRMTSKKAQAIRRRIESKRSAFAKAVRRPERLPPDDDFTNAVWTLAAEIAATDTVPIPTDPAAFNRSDLPFEPPEQAPETSRKRPRKRK